MAPFTLTQWAVVILTFLLGLFLGGALFAGGKWKRRYQDELARREALETENERLRRDAREMESLRHSAAKAPPPRYEDDRPL